MVHVCTAMLASRHESKHILQIPSCERQYSQAPLMRSLRAYPSRLIFFVAALRKVCAAGAGAAHPTSLVESHMFDTELTSAAHSPSQGHLRVVQLALDV